MYYKWIRTDVNVKYFIQKDMNSFRHSSCTLLLSKDLSYPLSHTLFIPPCIPHTSSLELPAIWVFCVELAECVTLRCDSSYQGQLCIFKRARRYRAQSHLTGCVQAAVACWLNNCSHVVKLAGIRKELFMWFFTGWNVKQAKGGLQLKHTQMQSQGCASVAAELVVHKQKEWVILLCHVFNPETVTEMIFSVHFTVFSCLSVEICGKANRKCLSRVLQPYQTHQMLTKWVICILYTYDNYSMVMVRESK